MTDSLSDSSPAADERFIRPSGRDEMNLTDFPFAMLRRQTADEGVYTYEGWITDREGNRQKQRWTVRSASGLGLPTEFDERVVVALMAISAEQGFAARKVAFSVYHVLQIMGTSRNQAAYDAVRRALERLVGVTIYTEGAFWDHTEKSWLKVKSGFHIIERYWLAYLEEDEAVRVTEGVPGYFVWGEDLWKSIRAGYIKYLDLDFYYGLNLPLARRLYRFLDKRMAYQEQYEIDVFDLTGRLGMTRYSYPSKAIEKLRPALDELKAKGFLAAAEAVKVDNYTRLRFQRGSVALTRGAGGSRAKRLAPPRPPAPAVAATPDGGEASRAPGVDPTGDSEPVVAALTQLGFTAQVAQQLVARHGADCITEKIAYLRWEQEVRRKPLRSPRGWLRRAIEEDYHAPAGYDPRWWDSTDTEPAAILHANEPAAAAAATPHAPEAAPEVRVWAGVLREIEGQVTPATFQSLFARTVLVGIEAGVATVAVPSAREQEWLERHWHALLTRTVQRQLGAALQLAFVRR